MDVIDDYIRALRLFLPRHERDDIARELSEEIRSAVAEKEAALGRPLGNDDKAAIVGQYGHPLLLAARYRPQRYLIGPIVFPYYWTVLKVVLGIIAITHGIGGLVMLANGASMSELGTVGEQAVATALKALGWITVLTAWLDLWLSRSRALERWQPDSRTAVERGRRVAAAGVSKVPRPDGHRVAPGWTIWFPEPSVVGLMVSTVVGVWWLAGLKVPQLFFGPGAADLTWGPAMDRVFPVLVVAQLLLLIDQLVRLIGADDARLFQVSRAVWLVAGWALIYLVATSDHHWMLWHGTAAVRGDSTIVAQWAGRDITLIQFVNYIWSAIFVFVAVMCAWSSLKGITRRLRRTSVYAAEGRYGETSP